jgi:hypothetical protein
MFIPNCISGSFKIIRDTSHTTPKPTRIDDADSRFSWSSNWGTDEDSGFGWKNTQQ